MDTNGSYQDLFAPSNFRGNLVTLSIGFAFQQIDLKTHLGIRAEIAASVKEEQMNSQIGERIHLSRVRLSTGGLQLA
jgi:ABC-type sulfate/molybdate transport systems ATPase subunit